MRGIIIGLICGILALPASAVTPRHKGTDKTCRGRPDDQRIASARQALHERKAIGGAIKLLGDQGPEGCQVVSEYLAEGAPGADEEDLVTALAWAAHQKDPAGAGVVFDFIHHGEQEVRQQVMLDLQKRLVELNAAEALVLVSSPHEDVRIQAPFILAGYYCTQDYGYFEVEVSIGGFLPVSVDVDEADFSEIECWGADELPRAHADGLADLAIDDEGDVREKVAFAAGRMLLLGHGPAETWGRLIAMLAKDDDEDVLDAVAGAVGAGVPSNAEAIIGWMLDNDLALDEDDIETQLKEGLVLRYEVNGADQRTLDVARYLEDRVGGSVNHDLDRLINKLERGLGK